MKESDAIKINKPILNRAQRKSIFGIGLYAEMDKKGYLNLKLQKIDGRKNEITSFESMQEAKNFLFKITENFQLCQRFTGLYETKKECFQYTIKTCDGACVGEISTTEYNARVQQFLETYRFENQHFLLIDKGRKTGERSAVWIENGVYKGYMFYNLNFQINSPEILKNCIIPMQDNRDCKRIIQNYIRKNKNCKLLTL